MWAKDTAAKACNDDRQMSGKFQSVFIQKRNLAGQMLHAPPQGCSRCCCFCLLLSSLSLSLSPFPFFASRYSSPHTPHRPPPQYALRSCCSFVPPTHTHTQKGDYVRLVAYNTLRPLLSHEQHLTAPVNKVLCSDSAASV